MGKVGKLPHGILTYDDFDVLHPRLAFLDDYLDCAGVPVCYRKYCIRQLLLDCTFGEPYRLDEGVLEASLAINDRLLRRGLSADAVRRWYADVYEHLSVRPPVSGFVSGFTPQPLVISTEHLSQQGVCFPGARASESLAACVWDNLISSRPEVVQGLGVLSALVPTRWVLLAMANYDMSVSCFRQAKPAFHLAMWETEQALEKLLKAVLIAKGFPEPNVKALGHYDDKILPALSSQGVALSVSGQTLVSKILTKGNASVRYEEAENRQARAQQKALALELHHDFLAFCHLEKEPLEQALPAAGSRATFPFCTDSFEALRRAVVQEHIHAMSDPEEGHSCQLRD